MKTPADLTDLWSCFNCDYLGMGCDHETMGVAPTMHHDVHHLVQD